jgi:hypothetical protein
MQLFVCVVCNDYPWHNSIPRWCKQLSNSMQIDLRIKSVIPTELRTYYEATALEFRSIFNGILEEVSKVHQEDINWHITAPLSRNPYTSQLFNNLLNVFYVDKLIRDGKNINIIIVESNLQKEIIEDYVRCNNCDISVSYPEQPKWRLLYTLRKIKPALIVTVVIIKLLREWLLLKYYLKIPIIKSSKPLVLIGTFVTARFDGYDNYYANLYEMLTETEQEEVYFIPSVVDVNIKELKNIISVFNGNPNKYLIKESFLQFKDYYKSFYHIIHRLSFTIHKVHLCGVNISGFIIDELRSMCGLDSSIQALLNYRFAKILKEKQFDLRLIVNWFENQIIEKGWYAGFNEYYPHTMSIGYAGYVASPYYLNLYPTSLEKKFNILPKKICVIGKGIIKQVKEFCPDLLVEVAPAFRFQHLWKTKEKKETLSKNFRVLVALPYFEEYSRDIISMLSGVVELLDDAVLFVIKLHPDQRQSVIEKICYETQFINYQITSKSISDELDTANLLISSGSSVSMESLAREVPVIVVGNKYGLTFHPIPENVWKMWRLCYSSKETAKAILSLTNIEEFEQNIDEIIKQYFSPVTKKRLSLFLNMTSGK